MYFPTSSALIEFLILAVLEQGDSYGYEISQTIKLIAKIKESTLYPILKVSGAYAQILLLDQSGRRAARYSKGRVDALYRHRQRHHRREYPP